MKNKTSRKVTELIKIQHEIVLLQEKFEIKMQKLTNEEFLEFGVRTGYLEETKK